MSELRDAYQADGVVRVPDVIAADDVRAMRERVLARVAEMPFHEVAGARRPARGTELDLWAIGREPAFAPLPIALAHAVDRVFGAGVWMPVPGEDGGLAAPNFPVPGAWTICEEAWHVDDPTPVGRPPGWVVLGFACLDRVAPGGGATCALAGSPRHLAELADRLGRIVTTDEALAALTAGEIPRRVVEITGEPGDIVLMDPRALHTISANVSDRPRLTMRMTCVRVS